MPYQTLLFAPTPVGLAVGDLPRSQTPSRHALAPWLSLDLAEACQDPEFLRQFLVAGRVPLAVVSVLVSDETPRATMRGVIADAARAVRRKKGA